MKKIIITICLSLCIIGVSAQKNEKYEAYVEKYAEYAVECQKEHGIPASITLAQGLLESAAGQSRLAKECNNHFGIKCGSSWYGRSMELDDDTNDECFRCYRTVKESYDDHAKFLQRARYAFLFDYKITDYEAWAYGLKRAGYATDPKYPAKLIKLIETYKLYEYDKPPKKARKGKREKAEKVTEEINVPTVTIPAKKASDYVVITNNGARCVKLLEDDTFENIADARGLNVGQLLYYNDLPGVTDLKRGDYVYLTKKRAQTKKSEPVYIVKAGDSMHSIAQNYGITLRSLYKMNNIKYGTPAETGMKLRLHK